MSSNRARLSTSRKVKTPLHVERSGNIQARLFAGVRPKGPGGRYETFANHMGFYIAISRLGPHGRFALSSIAEMETTDYGDWQHVVEACYFALVAPAGGDLSSSDEVAR
jgi:hypothetical protein